MLLFAILGLSIIITDKSTRKHQSSNINHIQTPLGKYGKAHPPAQRMKFVRKVFFPDNDYSSLAKYSQREGLPTLAFGLLAHSRKTIEGLIELLDRVYSPKHLYAIHVDVKVHWDDFKFAREAMKTKTNVVFTKNRINVRWGSFSIIQAELELLYTIGMYAVDHQFSFDYFLILDGSVYPLAPLHTIELEIASWPKQSNVVFMNNQTRFGMDRPTCVLDDDGESCQRTHARCITDDCLKYSLTPNNGAIYKGTQWVVLSREFVNYLLTNPDLFLDWVKFFLNAWVPDELFFQSVLLNSPMKNKRYQPISELVFTNWGACNHYRNPRQYSPCYHGSRDVPLLAASGALFARKFIAGEPAKKEIDLLVTALYTKDESGIPEYTGQYN